jgi:hypothetical protein
MDEAELLILGLCVAIPALSVIARLLGIPTHRNTGQSAISAVKRSLAAMRRAPCLGSVQPT